LREGRQIETGKFHDLSLEKLARHLVPQDANKLPGVDKINVVLVDEQDS
jgi:hypothetical protein